MSKLIYCKPMIWVFSQTTYLGEKGIVGQNKLMPADRDWHQHIVIGLFTFALTYIGGRKGKP